MRRRAWPSRLSRRSEVFGSATLPALTRRSSNYALDMAIVNTKDHAQLDQLRLRAGASSQLTGMTRLDLIIGEPGERAVVDLGEIADDHDRQRQP